MLLFIQIVLTIVAWVRGWKAKALIPIGSMLLLGFLVGFFIGLGGGHITGGVRGFIVLMDVGATIVLLVMSIKGKQIEEVTDGNTKNN